MENAKFSPAPPQLMAFGFSAGVLRIAWTREPAVEMLGRDGHLFFAVVTECRTASDHMARDDMHNAIIGLIVRAPDLKLSRVAGVESHCTAGLGRGAKIGIWLVPIAEPS